jgi:hypothetical protein
MAQVTDDWIDVDEGLTRLERRDAWRPIVAAIRRLSMGIRADARFERLEPSLSHACLVFRRSASHGVLVSWHEDDCEFGVAFVEPGFVLQGGVRVKEERVLEVLLEYLAQAARA